MDDLHPMGCVARVMRVIDARQESKQAIVVGVARTRLGPPLAESPALLMRLDPVPDSEENAAARDEVWKRVVDLAHRVIDLHDDYPDEWKGFVAGIPSAGLLADVIGSTLPLPPEEKLALLAEPDPVRRLERIARHLEREATIAEAQRTLSRQAGTAEVDPSQRERLLRRRMRDIESEIGDSDAGLREAEELQEKIDAAQLPEAAKAQAERELQRLKALPPHAPDRHLIRTYIEWMAELPWSKETEDKLDLPRRARGARRRSPRPREGQGSHPRVPRGAQARPPGQEPDPLLRRAAGSRQDLARPLGGQGDGPQVRPRLAGRRARRGRDPRPPPHLRRRHARADPAEPAPRGLPQLRVPARRDRQDRLGFPRRPVLGAARGARSGAERDASATTTSRWPSTSRA